MPAAVDTNVLLPIIRSDLGSGDQLVPFLDRFLQSFGLIISGPVYAELAAAPGMHVESLDRFLVGGPIEVDLMLSRDIWLQAAAAYRAYAQRRLASGAIWPRRILADFIIGAQAILHADLLLTYNSNDFARMFPALEVIVPPAPADAR